MFYTFRVLLHTARHFGGTAKLRAAYLSGGPEALDVLVDAAYA